MDQIKNGLTVNPDDTPESVQPGIDPGPSGHSAVSYSAAASLNPRSCVTCRRRKVRCNKQYPCGNCLKAHIDCTFPAPGRAPRRPRKPPDSELIARLHRLEGVVQSLGVQVDDDPRPVGSNLAGDAVSTNQPGLDYSSSGIGQQSSTLTEEARRGSLTNDFGRLVVSEGRSRYINSRYWASLSDEVEDLKQILNESSEDEPDSPSPATDATATPSQHGFIFNITSSANDLHNLHPPAKHINEYWHLFVEHCDPLMKMLHIPSTEEQILAVKDNPGKASKAIEVLLFAIYYAAITSQSTEECLAMTGESQENLARRYRYGLEQALVRAHFLVTEEIIVLQAFTIFLVCLHRFEDPRMIWSLCGVACRIAITLGLHRDGSNLGISPMEIEIRRRTWWQILILDIRSSEDHGSDPIIVQHSFDTRYPLNIEDEDITASMVSPPTERVGITRMSFCLVRYYSAKTFARLFARPASFLSPTGSWPEPTLQEKQHWIQVCHDILQEKFFRHCDMQNPLHWITRTVSKLILAKQWLALYQPFHRLDSGSSLTPEVRERIFMISLDSIESAVQLDQQRKTVKWGWLFKTYTQFHALAFVLSDLTRRTRGPLVERAWRAIDGTKLVFWDTDPETKRGRLMKPLMKLEAMARAARSRELSLEEAHRKRHQPVRLQEDEANGSVDAPDDVDHAGARLNPDMKVLTNLQGSHQTVGSMPLSHNRRYTVFDDAAFSHAAFNGNFYIDSRGNPVLAATQFSTTVPHPGHWQNIGNGSDPATAHTIPMDDWFTESSFGTVPLMSGAGIFDLEQQQLQPQQAVQHPQHHAHRHHVLQTQPNGLEPRDLRWDDWDNMFDTVMQGEGQGQSGSALPAGQWQRGPLVGESWL